MEISAFSHEMRHVESECPAVARSVFKSEMIPNPGHSRVHREFWSTPVGA